MRGDSAHMQQNTLVPSLPTVLFAVLLALHSPFLSSLEAKEPITLTDVQVRGTLRVGEDGVRLYIKARKGEPYDPAVVRRDVKSIYRMGFFDDVRAELTPDGALMYIVKERPYIKEVSIGGNAKVDREKIEAALGIKPRTILDRGKVSDGVEMVKKLYSEQGYANAKVDFAVSEIENNQAIIYLDIIEGKRLLIRKIRFEGNQVFSDKDLKKLMATKEKWIFSKWTSRGVLERDVLTNDMALLSAHYYDHGYIRHVISEPVILRRKEGMEVVVRIQEKDQYRVGKVEIGGDLIDEPEVLLDKIQLTSGQIFRGKRLREDITTLTDRYADDGFAFAQVDPVTRIKDEEKVVDVALVIKRGPPVHFNRITIEGNTKTRDKVIRRELEVAEQELISFGDIKRSQNALQRTGYFESVELITQKTDRNDEMDLHVKVKEGPTGTFSAGGGFSSGEGPVFNVSASEQNLFGRGQSLSTFFNLSGIRQDFVVNFTEPYLFDSPVSIGLSGFNNESKFNDFDSRRTGFGIRTGYPLKYLKMPFVNREDHDLNGHSARSHGPLSLLRNMRVGLGYQLSRDKVKDVDDDASDEIKLEEGVSLTSAITPSLSYDSRNHFFIPTEGTRSNLSLKYAGLGGDNRFIKTDSSMQWYYPLLNNPKWGGAYTFSVKSRLGYSVIFERSNDVDSLPISERYFIGGSNSVRGFEDRSLGPRDEEGEVVGGDKQFVLNTELRFPLLDQYSLYGVAFFDQGQAFRASDSINPAEFKRSVGLGGRWISPFGPIQIDFGFPINEEPGDETSLVSFSLGGRSF